MKGAGRYYRCGNSPREGSGAGAAISLSGSSSSAVVSAGAKASHPDPAVKRTMPSRDRKGGNICSSARPASEANSGARRNRADIQEAPSRLINQKRRARLGMSIRSERRRKTCTALECQLVFEVKAVAAAKQTAAVPLACAAIGRVDGPGTACQPDGGTVCDGEDERRHKKAQQGSSRAKRAGYFQRKET